MSVLPTDWVRVALTELLDFRNGINFVRADVGPSVKILGVGDFGSRESLSTFESLQSVQVQAQLGADDMLANDDLVFVRSNGNRALVGRCILIQDLREPVTFSGFTIRGRQASSAVDPFYLSKVMRSDLFTEHLRLNGGGSSISNLSQSVLSSFGIPLPPLAEQRKIAEILRTWDDAIDRAAQALAACRRQMDVLRGRVFRTSRGNAHWAKRALGEIATQVRTRSNGGAHPVMTISAKSGFVLQSDKYSRDMAGESLKTYTLLHEGDFAYNKGNSLTYPQGCIFALKVPTALVPSVYFSFRLDSSLNPTFYEQYFAAGSLNRQLGQIISSGVRGNGLLNVTAHDFFKCVVPVPPRAEQDLIASVLSEVSLEIGLLSRKVDALRTQKRGLMQKLLSGEIRVQVS